MENVAPNEKRLMVLGNSFTELENTHFEIISDELCAAVALRGSYSNVFLWENGCLCWALMGKSLSGGKLEREKKVILFNYLYIKLY